MGDTRLRLIFGNHDEVRYEEGQSGQEGKHYPTAWKWKQLELTNLQG